jgi:hypothetical protein
MSVEHYLAYAYILLRVFVIFFNALSYFNRIDKLSKPI